MLDEILRNFALWLAGTPLAKFMTGSWQWPVAESLHFIGLSMLVGTVGLFDLRLLGFAKQIRPSALHRLVPLGVCGYFLNFLSGICFFTNAPDQYMYNPSFQMKFLFMGVAGVNVAFFYTAMFRKVRELGSGENAPMPARIIGGVSLASWMGVITCGRLLTFFRPPFHWCPWC
jgi:hypothetical protein